MKLKWRQSISRHIKISKSRSAIWVSSRQLSWDQLNPLILRRTKKFQFLAKEVIILAEYSTDYITIYIKIDLIGIVINKSEINNWNGKIPIYEYPINEDLSPEIITKKSQRQVEYIQQLAIRYLKPPTPPTPGDIIITQEPDISVEPAPPIIIRQQPVNILHSFIC